MNKACPHCRSTKLRIMRLSEGRPRRGEKKWHAIQCERCLCTGACRPAAAEAWAYWNSDEWRRTVAPRINRNSRLRGAMNESTVEALRKAPDQVGPETTRRSER